MKRLKSSPVAPLIHVLADYKKILISVGCFTALINILMLVPSIYMLQVYDRVLSSQNTTTLAMLSLMVVGTPSSGPSGAPCSQRRSDACAWANASSGRSR